MLPSFLGVGEFRAQYFYLLERTLIYGTRLLLTPFGAPAHGDRKRRANMKNIEGGVRYLFRGRVEVRRSVLIYCVRYRFTGSSRGTTAFDTYLQRSRHDFSVTMTNLWFRRSVPRTRYMSIERRNLSSNPSISIRRRTST